MRTRHVVLHFLTLILATVSVSAASSLFTPTGSLNVARISERTTVLANGKVLISGGISSFPVPFIFTASSEIYDPLTHKFTVTGSLLKARSQHSATLLPNGKVLIAGGYNETPPLAPEGSMLVSSELYDPTTGTFSSTGSLHHGRYNHAGVLLPGGKVLVYGGTTWLQYPAEIYDPMVGTFTETTMTPLGFGTPLLNGKLLFNSSSGAFIYDPLTGLTTKTAHDMVVRRYDNSATLLPNGRVLIAGGYAYGPIGWEDAYVLSSAELYDPENDTFTSTGSLAEPRNAPGAIALAGGNVVIFGGVSKAHYGGVILNTVELYDVAQGTFRTVGTMFTEFSPGSSTPLPDGTILMAGGFTPKSECCSALAMLYQPSETEPVIDPAVVPMTSEWVLALLATVLIAVAFWRRNLG